MGRRSTGWDAAIHSSLVGSTATGTRLAVVDMVAAWAAFDWASNSSEKPMGSQLSLRRRASRQGMVGNRSRLGRRAARSRGLFRCSGIGEERIATGRRYGLNGDLSLTTWDLELRIIAGTVIGHGQAAVHGGAAWPRRRKVPFPISQCQHRSATWTPIY